MDLYPAPRSVNSIHIDKISIIPHKLVYEYMVYRNICSRNIRFVEVSIKTYIFDLHK